MRSLYFFISVLFLSFNILQAQVGIGTNTPDNSSMLEVKSTDKGILFPRMSTMQRTAITNPALGLHVFDTQSNSLWFYNGSFWVNYAAQSKYGDVKSGIHTLDHEGWVLLDGRATSSLSATQQAVATALGLIGNLPNATNAYMVQNGGSLGAVTGTNTATLTQANLPNVNFTGTAANAGSHGHTASSSSSGDHAHSGSTSSDGNHNHSGSTSTNGDHAHTITPQLTTATSSWALSGFGGAGFTIAGTTNTSTEGNHSHTLNINNNGTHAHTFSTNTAGSHVHSVTVNSSGDHTHSVSVSSGGSATPVNIAPRSMTVNMFIYLGL
jgi:hypothetical protein